MKALFLLALPLIASCYIHAQLLAVNPYFPADSSTITITVDCSRGNRGLYNYVNPGDVYVHTGVITSASTSNTDWRYVKFSQNFNQPNPALQASALGNNKYAFTIANIRAYYGVPAGETIKKIAILFRNGNGTSVQRNSDGSDMYLGIYDTALAAKFLQPFYEPRYIPVPEPIQKNMGDTLALAYKASRPGNISLFLNGALINTRTGADSLSATPVIASAGTQQVVGRVASGSITVSDTISFFIPASQVIAPLPSGLADGINYETGDTSVVLVLRAPGKTRVNVLGDFNNWTEQAAYQMSRTPDGKFFWLRIAGLSPAVEYAYQYKVNGTLKVADPYAQKILDPDNDPAIPATVYPGLKAYPNGKTTGIVGILQTRAPAYAWQSNAFTRPDKRSLVIYELLVRDIVAAHNWKALSDTLSYFKNLGITAIEIMPFNEFEGNLSWGYNPDFYFAPDKYYGPKNDLKAFVDACHANGMAVIMDIALNHSFGSSPLVQLYFDAANNRPDNANPWFNPVAKHAFNVGYDMNHESADTRYYCNRIMAFWLQEYRLDGFRFDLAKGFTQKQTCDNNGGNCDVNAWSAYDSSRVTIWKRYYDSLQTYAAHPYVILEHFAANGEESELSDYGMMFWGNLNYAFNQATMGYPDGSDFSQGLFTARGWTQPALVTYMESHDEERLMYKNKNYGNVSGSYNIKDLNTGLRRNEMATAFFFMMPGPKMIWQFGELGYDYSINTCLDGTVNNNCRTDVKPLAWNYLQTPARLHLHDVYTALLKLRAHPLFRAGFVTNRVTQSLNGVFKWMKLTTDTSNILVLGNFDVVPGGGTVSFAGAGIWYDYLTGDTIAATGSAQYIALQPGEYHVYINRNINNVVSQPPAVTPLADSTQLQVTVLGNPVQQDTQLKINLPGNGRLQFSLYDAQGRLLGTYDAGYRIKSVLNMALKTIAPSLSSRRNKGMYLLKVQYDKRVSCVKLLAVS